MSRYMIELSHDSSVCVEALEEIDPRSADLLDEVYWICMSGDHTGWVVVEADSEEQARKMVPELLRNQVIVRQVQLVTPELAQAIDPEAARPTVQDPDAS